MPRRAGSGTPDWSRRWSRRHWAGPPARASRPGTGNSWPRAGRAGGIRADGHGRRGAAHGRRGDRGGEGEAGDDAMHHYFLRTEFATPPRWYPRAPGFSSGLLRAPQHRRSPGTPAFPSLRVISPGRPSQPDRPGKAPNDLVPAEFCSGVRFFGGCAASHCCRHACQGKVHGAVSDLVMKPPEPAQLIPDARSSKAPTSRSCGTVESRTAIGRTSHLRRPLIGRSGRLRRSRGRAWCSRSVCTACLNWRSLKLRPSPFTLCYYSASPAATPARFWGGGEQESWGGQGGERGGARGRGGRARGGAHRGGPAVQLHQVPLCPSPVQPGVAEVSRNRCGYTSTPHWRPRRAIIW